MNRYQIIAPPEIEEEGEKLFKEWMKIGDPDDDFDPEEWEKFLQAHATRLCLHKKNDIIVPTEAVGG